MKKLKPSSSQSELLAWWDEHADRLVADGETAGTCLMSLKAMSNLKKIMGDDAALPMPISISKSHGGFRFGVTEMQVQMESLFTQRNMDVPNRIGISRFAISKKPISSCAFTRTEVFEWIWDVLAKHFQCQMESLVRVHEQSVRSRNLGKYGAERLGARL